MSWAFGDLNYFCSCCFPVTQGLGIMLLSDNKKIAFVNLLWVSADTRKSDVSKIYSTYKPLAAFESLQRAGQKMFGEAAARGSESSSKR